MIRLTIKVEAVVDVPDGAYPIKDLKEIQRREQENTGKALKDALSNLTENVSVTVEVDEV